MENLDLGVWGFGSGWALVTLFVVMLYRGDVATKRELLDKDRQLEKADELHAKDQQIIAELMMQLNIHSEVPRMIETTLRALHEAAGIEDPPHEDTP